MLILGIESSCDETAAAVVRDGNQILSSVISSQIDIHRKWGGVVPEIASREHLAKISPIVNEALDKAGVSNDQIDAVAVTQGPGLIGSLHVGVSYAKAWAFARGIPIVGVNHIEGHFYSVCFENPPIQYPALALIVSGGHTNIFHSTKPGSYRLVSRTRDDAAGEAFDKVAKMLGLGYPGGPAIERIAAAIGDGTIKFPKAKISDGRPDMSFSGLKTAVSRYIREHEITPVAEGDVPNDQIVDLAASFQTAVVHALVSTFERVAIEYSSKTLIVAGGVACNLNLRRSAAAMAERLGIPIYFPSKHLSTDNAAMIAAAGHSRLMVQSSFEEGLVADVTLRLQNVDVDSTIPTGRKRYRT